MQSEITRLNRDAAIGVGYAHAPSLMSALRADAELLASLIKQNGLRFSNNCMCKYTTGQVTARVHVVGSQVWVKFASDKTREDFSTVKVTFND